MRDDDDLKEGIFLAFYMLDCEFDWGYDDLCWILRFG